MVFVIGSTVVADTCVNDPDERVSQLLQQYGDFLDSVVLKFLIFYIKGCDIDMGPVELIDKVKAIENVFQDIVTFINEFVASDVVAEFQITCGTDPSIITAAGKCIKNIAGTIAAF